MLEDYGDILNMQDTAEILNVGEAVISRLFRNGDIPAQKVGREWRVPKDALIQFINFPTRKNIRKAYLNNSAGHGRSDSSK